MTILIMILAAIASYCAVKAFSDEDGRAPAFTTKKGKQARVIVGSLLLLVVSLLVYNTLEVKPVDEGLVTRIGSLLLGLSIPIFVYIRSRNRR